MADLINGKDVSKLSREDLLKELSALQEAINKPNDRALSYKVGEKGGLVVSGFGRFPVTLYYEQWVKLLDNADEIRAQLEAHKPELAMRADRFTSSNGTKLAS